MFVVLQYAEVRSEHPTHSIGQPTISGLYEVPGCYGLRNDLLLFFYKRLAYQYLMPRKQISGPADVCGNRITHDFIFSNCSSPGRRVSPQCPPPPVRPPPPRYIQGLTLSVVDKRHQ